MNKPLASAAERLKGKPGRPKKETPEIETVAVPPRLLDLAGTARYLGDLSPWTVRDLEATGILKRVRIPLQNGGELRKVLFDRVDLDRLVEAWKEKP